MFALSITTNINNAKASTNSNVVTNESLGRTHPQIYGCSFPDLCRAANVRNLILTRTDDATLKILKSITDFFSFLLPHSDASHTKKSAALKRRQ